jgi:Flp pilus assembly protein TadD
MADDSDMKNAETLAELPAKLFPGKVWVGMGVGMLVLIAFLIYMPSLRGGFVWDDDLYITKNPLVQSADGLRRIWCTTESKDYYPVTLSLFWLQWRLWGGQTFGFHVVNLALHVVNSLLLWLLLGRQQIRGGWLAALLFVVHPVNVPSVAWVTEMKNVLAMTFALACLLFYLEHERTGQFRWYALAILAFLLALLSKSAVVMVPCVMLGYARWRHGRINRRDLRQTAPFFVLSIALGLVTVWFQRHRVLEGATVMSGGFVERCGAGGWAIWFYLCKAMFPMHLSMVYEPWTLNSALRLSFLPLGLLVICTWMLWRSHTRWGYAVLFGMGCYLVMLFPVLGFIDQGFYAYSLVADHWQYVALPALCALVAGGCATLAVNRRCVACVLAGAALLVGFLGWQTRARCAVFASDETLWRDTVMKSPGAWVAHLNLANDLARRGEDEVAVSHYLRALEINPKSGGAHFNLAVVLARHGRLKEATAHLATACQIKPTDATWFDKLGSLFAEQKRFDQAAVCFAEAAHLDPNDAVAHYNLGIALGQLGKWEEAQGHLTEALRLTPTDGDVHYALARSLLRLGKLSEAVNHYREGLRYAPLSPQAGETFTNLLATGQHP